MSWLKLADWNQEIMFIWLQSIAWAMAEIFLNFMEAQ